MPHPRIEHLSNRTLGGTGGFVRAELKSFLAAWTTFFRRLPALRADCAAGVEQLTSIDFWREVYPETRQPRACVTPPSTTSVEPIT